MIRQPRSLRGLTVAFLCLFLTVTILAGLGTFYATLLTINELVDQRIESESHELAEPGEPVLAADLEQRIGALRGDRDTGDLGVLLIDAQGRRIAGNASLARPLPLGFSSLGGNDRIEGLSSGRVLVRAIGGGMRLAVFAETEPIDHYFAARRRIYLIGFGAIVIVVLTGLLLFRRLVGQRIEEMRRTVESIIEGDLAQRVPLNGDGGEFDQQAAAFNRMLDRITTLMAEIRNVSNNISHELRTPLARLRNELALLEQQAAAQPVHGQLTQATAQADDLLAMFSALLRIAEIESGTRRAGFEPLELGDLVEEVTEILRPVAEEAGQSIAIEPYVPCRLVGDRQLLLQMLLNLVENALRHTPAGTQVQIVIMRENERALLSVADNGAGIPAEQRPLVMRRFGRLDRSHPQSGHGLGLPLVNAIVRLHRGMLVLEDAQPGLRVVIAFPL